MRCSATSYPGPATRRLRLRPSLHRGRTPRIDPTAALLSMRLSVIIPVLNEAQRIVPLLETLRSGCDGDQEVIVVDAASSDGSATLARPLADRVISTSAGRALQMNAGARIATGEVLLFLHADTTPPPDFALAIERGLRQQGRGWGRFDVRLSGHSLLLRVVEALMNWRSRASGIATGDQAIFCRRGLFEQVGGFPDIGLMEDIVLSSHLKRVVDPVCLRERVTVSSRRWERDGILRTVLLMWGLRLAFALGVDPAKLSRIYYPPRAGA